MEALEHELDGAGDRGRASRRRPRPATGARSAGTSATSVDVVGRRHVVAGVHDRARPSNASTTSRSCSIGQRALNTVEHRRLQQAARRSARRGPPRASRSRPCRRSTAASASRSLTRGTTSVSPRRRARRVALATSVSWLATDEAHRHARALVDVRALAGQLAERGDDLGHERRARCTRDAVGRRAAGPPGATIAISVSTSSG